MSLSGGVWKPFGLAVVFALASLPCGAKVKSPPGPGWVGTWACSPQLASSPNRRGTIDLSGKTLRQIVHLTIGGDELRFKFSNEFGLEPLVLASVHIALPGAPGAIRTDTDRALSFSGNPSVTIQAGAFMLSDPIDFKVAPLSDLVVTFHAAQAPDQITGHPGSRETSYLVTGDEVSQASLTNPSKIDHWYVLDGINVEAQKHEAAIVTLGDSITDGHGSITNGNTRWPDYLAGDLAASKKYATISVLNQGIGANTILHGGAGPPALARFDRDAIAQPGVRWVIVFEGVNDIGGTRHLPADSDAGARTADEIIQAYQQFIVRAHTHGLFIYGATITPFGGSFYDTPLTEAERDKVNAWIRTSGHFDAVIDFDKVVRDPQNPERLDPADDSGDHLHPNSEGYKRMAAAIDLKLFAH